MNDSNAGVVHLLKSNLINWFKHAIAYHGAKVCTNN